MNSPRERLSVVILSLAMPQYLFDRQQEDQLSERDAMMLDVIGLISSYVVLLLALWLGPGDGLEAMSLLPDDWQKMGAVFSDPDFQRE